MSQHREHRDCITDEAALWFVRAQGPELSAAERRALASWLAGSAEHVREYLFVAAVTQDIRSLSSTPSVDDLIELAREATDDANVVALLSSGFSSLELEAARTAPGSKESRSLRRGRPALWATAATLLLAIAASTFYVVTSGPVTYTTGVGEQMSFPLKDGSVVTLNAQSSLELAYTEAERSVRLVQGEALFAVAKNPDRPFRVLTERAVIQAIGTQFNVRFRGEDTTVTVVEGIVEVRLDSDGRHRSGKGTDLASSDGLTGDARGSVNEPIADLQLVRLTAGQQASVSPRSAQVAVAEIKVEKATSWRERRLSFDAWPLSKVVDEFNLYNDQRIVIQDRALAEKSISGVFGADDRGSFALFLDEAGLAVAETQADGTIVLRGAKGRL
jgi:transmembrane sensor